MRSSGLCFIPLGFSPRDVMFLFFMLASGEHCASLGTVCETGRAERGERLHVRQVSAVFLFMAGILQKSLYAANLSGLFFSFSLPLRCKKKVPATKRFTVHRTSNVLTVSLKRFANFSGGKITKVNGAFSYRRPFSFLFLTCRLMFLLCLGVCRMWATRNS